ncbi:MAG TPA: four-helix bundle copper-binding protein [Paludibacter sp.]|nr:four-helix bundle copper-binding protein [Paludibacter sp.]
MSHERFQNCIDECNSCATMCNHCAVSCLHEDDAKTMATCIELDMQCAAICRAAAEMMSLGSQYAVQLCALCAQVCDACGMECGRHNVQHCQDCAEACRNCAIACREMSLQNATV